MSKLQSLFAKLPVGFSKQADGSGVESADDVQMEQDFGRLAYTFLKDRASGLIPYLLGFEVVDREEDGSRAVGIFGFKLNRDYYYVPVFFINNQIKGMDLLFNKRTNSFMPLRESWINYLVNKQTIELGGGRVDKNIRQDFEWPRFDFLAIPPSSPSGIPKSASVIERNAILAHLCANPELKDADLQKWASVNALDMDEVKAEVLKVANAFSDFLREGKAKKEGVTEKDVPKDQLEKGEKVEGEHTSNPKIKKKIAMDHLAEFKNYYTGLSEAEKKMKADEKSAANLKIPGINPVVGAKEEDDKDEDEKDAVAIIKAGFNAWNQMQQSVVDAMDKDVDFQEALGGAMARLQKQALPFAKTAEGSDLVRFLGEHGGIPAVNMLMKTINSNFGFAKAAMSFYPGVESLFVTKFAQRLDPETKPVKLTVITESCKCGPDGEQKKKLVRDGFVIHDTREADEVSEVYDVSYDKRFANPDTTGQYNVLLGSGSTTPCWVFMPCGFGRKNEALVVETNGLKYKLAEPGAIFVRDDVISADKAKDPYEKAVEAEKMQIGSEYVFIDEKMHASRPFSLKSIVAESGKRKQLNVSWQGWNVTRRESYGHDFEMLHDRSRSYPAVSCEPGHNSIQLADYKGHKLGESGEAIIVPSNWKALELNIKSKDEDEMGWEAREAMRNAFSLGNLSDMTEALNKNAFHKLTVGSDDGLEYFIRFDDSFVDGKPMAIKDATIRLVGAYGLAVGDAEDMLKEAHDNFKSRRLIKLAQLAGVQMPYPPAQPSGVDPYTGAITQSPQAELVQGNVYGAPKPQNTMRPGFNMGGEAAMDQQAAGLAQQAEQAGQKKVFDHSAIGGLSKVYDSSSVIDTYLPDLMKAMDRLGRIVFLFYWKNDEFVTRYGQQDVAEMEDTLRGVFKNFGDLILKLKQKTIDSDSMDDALSESQG